MLCRTSRIWRFFVQIQFWAFLRHWEYPRRIYIHSCGIYIHSWVSIILSYHIIFNGYQFLHQAMLSLMMLQSTLEAWVVHPFKTCLLVTVLTQIESFNRLKPRAHQQQTMFDAFDSLSPLQCLSHNENYHEQVLPVCIPREFSASKNIAMVQTLELTEVSGS